MKLRTLSEQLSGTVYLDPEEMAHWEKFTAFVNNILASYPGKFRKEKGLLSWKIFRSSGVQNPADDWEDEFDKIEPIVDVAYDKFGNRPAFTLRIHHGQAFGDPKTNWTQERYELETGFEQMEQPIRQALEGRSPSI